MSERRPSVLIEDILKCIEHVRSYSNNISFDQFSSNFMAIEACLYNIQVIGEAVSKIPQDIKDNNPEIPWPLIKGMRNRLIHEYFGTDHNLVWNVIKIELPALESNFKIIHSKLVGQNK